METASTGVGLDLPMQTGTDADGRNRETMEIASAVTPEIITLPVRRSERLKAKREARTQVDDDSNRQTVDARRAPTEMETNLPTDTRSHSSEHSHLDEQPNLTTDAQEDSVNKIFAQWSKTATCTDNNEITSKIVEECIEKLDIKEQNYLDDDEFVPMYKYLKYSQLSGNNDIDRKTLLLAENYYLENDYLFKISLPRTKKETRLRPEYNQLCVPKPFQEKLIIRYHEILGHYSIKKLHPTLITRYFWKSMIQDIKSVVKNCKICQFSKNSPKFHSSPLFPLPCPFRPFSFWSFDHKKLVRQTLEGNNYILAFICHFSNYCVYIPVPNETAYTTARVFVRDIICRFGKADVILSDRGKGYMSIFFATISKILGIKHRASAVMAKRTNGIAERCIRSLNEGLKIYSTPEIDDTRIELLVLLIEYSLRATCFANMQISPFEICHGFPMPTPIPTEINIPQFLSSDAENYARWLANSIRILHNAVRSNRLENKKEMNASYDKYHNSVPSTFKIGDYVLLKDTRIQPLSNRVLTKRPFEGPFLVKDVIQHDQNIGPAYKLIDIRNGKELQRLINVDRLKLFRDKQFDGTREQTTDDEQRVKQTSSIVTRQPRYALAVRILKHERCTINGEYKYLVRFANEIIKWTKTVGPCLLREYNCFRRQRRTFDY